MNNLTILRGIFTRYKPRREEKGDSAPAWFCMLAFPTAWHRAPATHSGNRSCAIQGRHHRHNSPKENILEGGEDRQRRARAAIRFLFSRSHHSCLKLSCDVSASFRLQICCVS